MSTPLRLAKGFSFAGLHAGIKAERKDLALIASELPCAAAVVGTQNRVRAACVDRTLSLTPADGVRAIIVNSGNANCFAGPDEVANDVRMAAAVATHLSVDPSEVLTASTGSIGRPLQIETIEAAVPELIARLVRDPHAAAEAVLTTDLVSKLHSRRVELSGGVVTITAIAKGSGMVHPGMATMLAFLCTDAKADAAELRTILKDASDATFNQISVDRDTSTNDMAMLLANGASGVDIAAGRDVFAAAVLDVCEELGRQIAADGEGATRLVGVRVGGAPDLVSARALSRAVVESNLFKSSLFGDSTGWTRALAALGARAAVLGVPVTRDLIDVEVNHVPIVTKGQPTGRPVAVPGPKVRVEIDLGIGEATAWAWGCDLSYDYVSINAVTKQDPLETHSPGLKRRLLVEALTYIRRFHGRLAVIKYGGAAMVRDSLKDAFAEDLVLLSSAGLLPVVVHGGGPEISRMLEKLGEKVRFVDGIRVTDQTSMKVVEMVLTGSVNTDVVTRIHTCGGRAIGLSGKDGALLQARKLERGGHDLGMVGEVTEVRTDVIEMLLERNYIPVISPIGVDSHGTTYNINADMVAAQVAVALQAEKLIFLTDVPGILNQGVHVTRTTPAGARELIDTGVVTGGMIPKVEAMLTALAGGVTSAHIVDGRVPHNLLAELFTDNGVGTWIRST